MATVKDLEAQVAALTERVLYIECKCSQTREHLAFDRRVAHAQRGKKIVADGDVEGFNALNLTEQANAVQGADLQALVAFMKALDPKERKRLFNMTGPKQRPLVAFHLAAPPAMVEFRLLPGHQGMDAVRLDHLELTASQTTKLTKAGFDLQGRFVLEGSDAAFLIQKKRGFLLSGLELSVGGLITESERRFDAWLAVDQRLAALVAEGRLQVRELPEDEARQHIIKRYNAAPFGAAKYPEIS